MNEPKKTLRQRLSLRFYVALVLALVAAGGFFWMQRNSMAGVGKSSAPVAAPAAGTPSGQIPGGRPPTRVVMALVKTQDFPIWVKGLGTVTPERTVTVHTQIAGQLMKVNFREGQMVSKGDLLALVDPRPYEVQLAQYTGTRDHDLALLKAAKLDLDRYRALADKGAVSRQQLDAQISLVAQYEANVASDVAQMDNARLQISYCNIKAPVSGRLGLRQVDPGNLVQPSDTNGIVVITQISPTTVIFTLPQDVLTSLHARLKAEPSLAVEAWDRSDARVLAAGALITVDNQIDPTTGMVKLRALFPNKDGNLVANQFVNAHLLLENLKQVLVVPTSAIQQTPGGPVAWVVNEQKVVTMRKLTLGSGNGAQVVVKAGLAEGEVVVTDGLDNLREGSKVIGAR
jgi:multidrug efflux system membrane fusion protein